MDFRFTDDSGGVKEGMMIIADTCEPVSPNTFTAKRVFDIAAAGIGLVMVAPLLALVCLLIRLQDGGPAIFVHNRIGLNGRMFGCFKLRSMVPDARERLEALLERDPEARREWEETQKLTNDPRVTPLGRFIRASSIDELPQLVNVLRGEMSLVGPRPISSSERSKYGEYFGDYCSVIPGITGLWQISGRSDVSYGDRVQMDVAYARSRSFWGDVMIVLKTIPAVLLSKGAK